MLEPQTSLSEATDKVNKAPPQESQPATSTSLSIKGVSVLAGIQLLTRALTFVLNQVLVRLIAPEVFAYAAGLDLYVVSVLYFAREGVRGATARIKHGEYTYKKPSKGSIGASEKEELSPNEDATAQAITNLAFLSIVSGIILSGALAYVYNSNPDSLSVSSSNIPLALYALRCFVEMLGEPAFLLSQHLLLYSARGKAEAAATVARVVLLSGLAHWTYATNAGVAYQMLAFGVGEVAFGVILSTVLTATVFAEKATKSVSFWPTKIDTSRLSDYFILSRFSFKETKLAATITIQSVIKYALTQGDNVIMASRASIGDRAGYALAANYGSLIARLVFQPIEESSRNLFSQLCTPFNEAGPVAKSDKGDTTESAAAKANNMEALDFLSHTLFLYHMISLAAIALAAPLSSPLLTLLAGSRWAMAGNGSALHILRAYCYYIPFLAYNGITEAFVSAVATPRVLAQQSAAMAVFFAVFAATAAVALADGEWSGPSAWLSGGTGIVVANSLNMALRTGWSCWFIARYFGEQGLPFSVWESLPSVATVTVAAAGGSMLRSEPVVPATAADPMFLATASVRSVLMTVVKMGAVSALVGTAMLLSERSRLQLIFSKLKTKRGN